MCCFSGAVRHVEGTKIFARALDPVRQALVYSMTLAADAPVAMVLPLPVAGELTFVNLEGFRVRRMRGDLPNEDVVFA